MDGGMKTITVVFHFSFRTCNPTEVHVLYQLADKDATDCDFGNDLKLINSPDSNVDFLSDLTINESSPKRLFFKFRYYDNCYSRPASYLITKSLQDPVVISDFERTDNAPVKFTIRFKINYQTYYGQILYIVGSLPELGFWDINYGLRLFHSGTLSQSSKQEGLFSDTRYNWQVDQTFANLPPTISYRYVVVNGNSEPYIEPGTVRYLQFSKDISFNFLEFNDIWRWNEPAQNLFSKRLFDGTLVVRKSVGYPMIEGNADNGNVLCKFCAHCGVVGRARRLFVVGSIPELSQWNPTKGAEMRPSAELQWSATVSIPRSRFPFEFKFVAIGGADVFVWENHENRTATLSAAQANTQFVNIDSWHVSFTNLNFHGAGVCVDLSQLLVSDFNICNKVVLWAAKAGFAAVHLSGLLDTTAMTNEFTNLPLSGFAINPLYADMSDFHDFKINQPETRENILAQKISFLRDFWKKSKGKYMQALNEFRENNKFWLQHYETLCFELNKTNEDNYSDYQQFVDFVQYFLYLQLQRHITIARDSNIAVGIDINFAISEKSAEARYQQELFKLKYSLGVPPSQSNPLGTVLEAYPYDFDNAEGWFKQRISHFSKIFSIIRLESTIRFFRQWIVPRETSILAISGHFDPSVFISFAELETWGLWDVARYIHPYIRPQLLQQLFGDDAMKISNAFLVHKTDGSISFKNEFNNERKLATAETTPEGEELRSKYLPQLLRLLNEVLLVAENDHDYRPRPLLQLAATEGGKEKSFSFSELPLYHQNPFIRLEDEFVNNKQRCLWSFTGRQVVQHLTANSDATFFSDAAGINGDICDEALSNVSVLPLRVQMEGRTKSSLFDDIRGYPYYSLASPQSNMSVPMRVIWKNMPNKASKLWEEEFFESGVPPKEYEDSVAVNIMKQHCWSASMWVLFPIDSLMGAGRHIVEREHAKYGVLDIEAFMKDEEAMQKISEVLQQTKRK